MEPTDTASYQQPTPSPTPAATAPMAAGAPVQPHRSFGWIALLLIALLAIAAVLYWTVTAMMPPQQEMPQNPSSALSVETDAVANEINALSTDNFDAELGKIDAALAQ